MDSGHRELVTSHIPWPVQRNRAQAFATEYMRTDEGLKCFRNAR